MSSLTSDLNLTVSQMLVWLHSLNIIFTEFVKKTLSLKLTYRQEQLPAWLSAEYILHVLKIWHELNLRN